MSFSRGTNWLEYCKRYGCCQPSFNRPSFWFRSVFQTPLQNKLHVTQFPCLARVKQSSKLLPLDSPQNTFNNCIAIYWGDRKTGADVISRIRLQTQGNSFYAWPWCEVITKRNVWIFLWVLILTSLAELQTAETKPQVGLCWHIAGFLSTWEGKGATPRKKVACGS